MSATIGAKCPLVSANVGRCRVAHWTTFAQLEFGERHVRSPRIRRRVSLGLQQTSAPGAHYIRRRLAHASTWAATVYARARARGCRRPHAIRILGRARGRASSGAAGKTAWPTILAAIAPARCLRHDRVDRGCLTRLSAGPVCGQTRPRFRMERRINGRGRGASAPDSAPSRPVRAHR